ncbi:MAG: type II secretion system protein [Dehalococcoidia bacterium]|nr:type II secretion system protein [Dehalococcoidia bacterium]
MAKKLKENQQGFTLVELLVAVAILGAIGSAMFGVIFGIMRSTEDNNGRVEALTGIEYAAHQIAVDGMSADPDDSIISDHSVTLGWTAPATEGGATYQIVYSLSGTDLQRQSNVTPFLKTVAQDVSDITFTESTAGFKMSITSSGGASRISETREYDITLRLN